MGPVLSAVAALLPGELLLLLPLSVGLTTLVPFAGGELDVDEGGLDVDEGGVDEGGVDEGGVDEGGVDDGLVVLPDADVDALTLGLAVLVGVGLAVGEQVLAGLAAFLLPAALTFAFAEADVLALLALLALALAVVLAEVVPLAPAVLSLELALALPLDELPMALALPLVPSPAGLVTGVVGVPFGDCDWFDPVPEAAGLGLGDDEVADGHTVAFSPLGLVDVAPGPDVPFDEPAALPDPARLGTPPLGLEEEIPTADPSWTKASRSGGTARATPMANTAQAAARAGRSHPYCQFRDRRW